MAIILKPRSNKQGIVDTSADLANVEGRDNYTVLVKDLGVFEWLATGVVDGTNIIAGKVGVWSRVLQSAEGLLPYTAEDQANKSTNVITDAASDVKYPSVRATKEYADSLVTGLLDDRGNFTPDVTSPGGWPTTSGSGVGGAIMKGDIWFCSASGFMGTTAVVAGSSFRAVVDSPGQTAGNWNVLSAGAITSATPNLQQVTTAGSTSSNSISLESTSGNILSVKSTSDQSLARIDALTGQGGFLRLTNATGGIGRIRSTNVTGIKTVQLPNAEGTLALTTDVALPYKVYTASVVLGSGTVTTTVHQNTIGDGSADGVNDIAWSTDFFGYVLTMSGSTAFPIGKTWIQSANYISGNEAFNFYGFRVSNTVLNYRSMRPSDNSYSKGFGPSIFIEIRVYP
jgi:hypothetical protein